MEADFRPKIDFDRPPLAQERMREQETLQYETPQRKTLAQWTPNRLFVWPAGVSATINVILCFCFMSSSTTSRTDFGFGLLLAAANLPAIPVVYLLSDVLDALARSYPGAGWLFLIFFCCLGSVMWGLTTLLGRELFRFVAWLFGDCW